MKFICYVDGFNLYHRRLEKTSYKWLNLGKLCQRMLSHSGDEISKIKYFTSKIIPYRESDNSKWDRQYLLWQALSTLPNLERIEGRFSKRKKRWRNPSGEGVYLKTYVEKGTDVNIATNIIYDCCRGNFDGIVLLSNDTDLSLPLYFAKKIFQKRVIVISPAEDVRGSLSMWSDVNKTISEEDVKACQFPDEVVLKNGRKIKKPSEW